MNMDTGDLATSEHVEDAHHPNCTLSQLEMDAVGVLLQLAPATPPKELHAVLRWSRKRKRSYRLGDSDHKEGEKFCEARFSTFDHFLSGKGTFIDTAAGEKLSKDLNARATSPDSPLPSSQVQCGTDGLGALIIPLKVPRVKVEDTSLQCKPWSVPEVEEKEMQASITKDLDIALCTDVDAESSPLMKPTQEAKIQPDAEVSNKSAGTFTPKILCRQLLKLAVRLGWEIECMRNTKELMMEELQSLKNQIAFFKQQHSSTAIQVTTNASKPKVPSLLSSAQDHCTVIKHGGERVEGTIDISSESTEHNSNAYAPTTPSSIDVNGQNAEECIIDRAPNCITWTSPSKNMIVPEAQVEAIVEKEPSPTSDDVQRGAHAEVSLSNEHGLIDAHGTWVIVKDCAETDGNGVHAQLTCSTREDLIGQADDVLAQTQGDLCVDITCSTCKQKVTPTRARTASCVEDIPAELAAPPSYTNQCVDSNAARQAAHSNLCADISAPSYSQSAPSSLSFSIDGIPNYNASAQLLQCPLQISDHAALAQLASSIYERLQPQAIVLLCDRRFAFAEARRRRKEIIRIKRHQSRASKRHG